MALYDAFISYSHAKDKPIAAALQSKVQKLGKPWYRRRALRVFRDDTSLSATPTLWPSIETALGELRFLILLASPEAAASPWVGKEVAFWLDHKGADTLLVAVTAGELAWDGAANDFGWHADTSLPAVLKSRFPSEPKWVDLRGYRDGADACDAKFTELAADFAAAIHGMPKEDLLSQEVRQQRRALRLAWSAAASLLLLAGFASVELKLALDAERLAQQQRDRAERALAATADVVTNVAGGIVTALRERVGMPVDLSRDILQLTLHLQGEMMRRAETTPQLRHSAAGTLQELAQSQLQLGNTAKALEAVERAAAIMDELAASEPDNAERQFDRLMSFFRRAEVAAAMGRRDEALAILRRELERAERLRSAGPPANPAMWQKALAAAYGDLGDLLLAGGRHQDALAVYQKSLAMEEMHAITDPQETARLHAVALGRIGDARLAGGDLAGALAAHDEGLAISRELAAEKSGDLPQQRVSRQRTLAARLDWVGDVRQTNGDQAGATALFEESLAIRRKLAAADPDNVGWQSDLSASLENVGDARRAAGDWSGALTLYEQSLANRRKLATAAPGDNRWQFNMSVSFDRIGDVQLLAGRPAEALAAFQESLAIRRQLTALDRDNTNWQRSLAIVHEKLGDVHEREGRRAQALQSFRDNTAITEKLAATDPRNVEWQQDLARGLERLAGVFDALGQRDAAVYAIRKLLPIRERRAAANPGDPRQPWELAHAHERIADTLKAAKRHAEAAQAYRAMVAALERGAAAASAQDSQDRTAWRRGLMTGHARLGDELLATGHPEDALTDYRQSLAMAQELRAAEPDYVRWQNDLSIIREKIGNAMAASGRREEALAEYRESLAIREKLAAAEPADTSRQNNLANSLDKIGTVAEPAQARAALRQALTIVEVLAQAGKLAATQRDWPQSLRDRLAKLPPEQGELQ